ncbi:aminotransferase class III-fold pyridoxal phosphate-dependent enzyme [Alkalibaculum sp. M08DMB]|uniref:(S)-3-amino-2-methylpropionate transaminase n=1 Tax=Alkalibaculum sporogenes TaxID=2655001 RepID=A0A6A7K872_9FIRM|nr:aspartate aminotransferase family protein [Alkalibaculum sporogenes]MPW25572.1 aminotransferase class III-fold pyridoxal phosphate-dependent enzyme [Alkalibaculum sporogenes]
MKYDDYSQYLSPVLVKATNLVAKEAYGCYITTVEGEKYLDFVQGIAVNALGHSHPKIVDAVKKQVEKLTTASFNLVNYEPTLKFSKRLASLTPGDLKVSFFSNGGAEAIDGAIKLARVATGRQGIIAFKGSFHGRTIGASSVTGSSAKYKKGYDPLMPGVNFTSYPYCFRCEYNKKNDDCELECTKELDDIFNYIISPDQVAAIIMEPIQGEGGYIVPPKNFVLKIREICNEYGILLIFDEIQSGYGRTGKFFASEHFDIVPDIMTLGKAIGGGFPMSAIISTKCLMDKWPVGTHGTTFGGHPVIAAAANAVLDAFEEENIIKNCNEIGSYLKDKLYEFKSKYDVIGDVRGLGLMIGIEFVCKDGRANAKARDEIIKYCIDKKLLMLGCGKSTLRFCTPLNVSKEDVDKSLEIIEMGLKTL